MTISAENYAPNTALDAVFTSRAARQTDRLWANEKHTLDAGAVGTLSLFVGPGPNPMALSGASTAKAWLRVDPDVTENAGSLRVYQGSGDATNQANWPVMTPGRYFAYLRTAAGASTEVADHASLSSRSAIASTTIGDTITHIYTAGYTTAGDGGAALYKRLASAPGSPSRKHAQSADGDWWELAISGAVIVEQLGARGDGATNDSEAFGEALALGAGTVSCTAGKVYRVKDITLADHDCLRLNGAKLKAASGAKWIVRLTGFAPELDDGTLEDFERYCCRETSLATTVAAGATSFVVASATNMEVGQWFGMMQNSDLPFASIITGISGNTVTTQSPCTFAVTAGQPMVASWGMVNIQAANRALLDDLDFVNTSVGIFMDRGGPGQSCERTSLRSLRMTDVYYAGICEGRDVSECNKLDVRVRGGVVHAQSHTGNGVTVAFNTKAGKGIFLKADASVTVNGAPAAISAYSQYAVTLASAPANGAAVIVYNSYDAWFGIWIDETGWTRIRGGDVWMQVDVLDGFYGVFLKQKDLLTTVGLIVDTCQVGIGYVDCANQYHTSPFVGFCSRTINVINTVGVHLLGGISTSIVPAAYTVSGVTFGNIFADATSSMRIDTHGWTIGLEGASRDISGGGSVELNIAEIKDANNVGVQYANTFRHLTSGVPAAGIGVGTRYQVETSPGVSKECTLQYVATDVTPGAEKFEMRMFLHGGGDLRYTSDDALKINGVPVLTTRQTGWGAPTGTATRSAFATGSVTTAQLAERVKALIDDLATHGIIGA